MKSRLFATVLLVAWLVQATPDKCVAAGDFLLAPVRAVVNEGAAPMNGYTWNQVLQARYGAANVEWAAPKIASDPLTLGVLRTPAGEFELASGWNGYGGMMPKEKTGKPGRLPLCVPATVLSPSFASLMRRGAMGGTRKW